MSNEDAVRLRHMLDAARRAIDFMQGRAKSDLESDEQLSLAVVRLLEILGEAAKNVSEDLRKDYPDIPWRQIAGTRDRLIHGYFDVDLDIVWQIISTDLPVLVVQLEKALS
jgi:uncharacterized protein with HEPN domain